MNKLILAAVALISTSAFATCPTINGTYNCAISGGGSAQEQFSTTVQNGVTEYTIGDIQILTDGKQHPAPSELMPNGEYTADCNAKNQLVVNVTGSSSFELTAYLVNGALQIDQTSGSSSAHMTCTPN